jgi:hypothetical protein
VTPLPIQEAPRDARDHGFSLDRAIKGALHAFDE